jgi:hypothetical protein
MLHWNLEDNEQCSAKIGSFSLILPFVSYQNAFTESDNYCDMKLKKLGSFSLILPFVSYQNVFTQSDSYCDMKLKKMYTIICYIEI